jgi:site-specific DNA-methyltransferase (adenine-specific)
MKNKLSTRNKTINLTEEEKKFYLEKPDSGIISGNFFDTELPPSAIDLAIVDPPYNLSKTFGGSNFSKMSNEEYLCFTEKWVEKIKPLLKKTATIYVCCDWKSSLAIGNVLQKNFIIRNRITWQREKGRGSSRNWKNSMEDIWFATVSGDYTFNAENVKLRRKVLAPYKLGGKPRDWTETDDGKFRDTYPSNFWDDISIPYWSMAENTAHPTQKPEKLIAKLILASSNEGDLVFDPFLGSGTTAVVAKKLGRKYLGVEAEDEYLAVTKKRLETADSDKRIQGYTGGIFWERNSSAEQNKYV